VLYCDGRNRSGSISAASKGEILQMKWHSTGFIIKLFTLAYVILEQIALHLKAEYSP
jgi:hypothetical protein